MARFLSVWSPNWPITRHRRAKSPNDAPAEAPFALVEVVRNARRLAAVDLAGQAEGLFPGQTLADARALVPTLEVEDWQPEADCLALIALADWCERYSPAVAIDPPDGLLIDVGGQAGLWGGEQGLLDDLLARLARAGVPARGAIACSPGAAWALARFGGDRRVVDREHTRAALEALPIAALRLEPAVADNLARLGFKQVGAVTRLPRPSLVRRFGKATALRLDQALGLAEEALSFRRAPAPFHERLALVEPISAPEDMVRVAGDILDKLQARLLRDGRGARSFKMAFHRVDGAAPAVTVGTARPERDRKRLLKLFAPKLETIDPGFGIEVVTLSASHDEPIVDKQSSLKNAQGDETARQEAMAVLVDRLCNRLGEDRVWRPAPYPSWTPERACVHVPVLSPAVAEDAWPPDRPRPMRLFKRPEPISVIAELPDDPPARFTWRGRQHRVALSEGPERVAEEWWRKLGSEDQIDRVRDYYRVEDSEGRRFWIFRSGLYGAARPTRWWIHGLFA
jgi:protein ImuB